MQRLNDDSDEESLRSSPINPLIEGFFKTADKMAKGLNRIFKPSGNTLNSGANELPVL